MNDNYFVKGILIISLVLFFSSMEEYNLAIYTYLIILIFLLIDKNDLLIFLYIALLPTNGFVPDDFKIFGYISLLQLTHFIVLFRLWQIFHENKINPIKIKRDFQTLQAISLIIFFSLCYYLVSELKQTVLMGEPLSKIPIRVIKNILVFLPLYYLSFLALNEYYKKIIKLSFLTSVVIIAVSIILSPQLKAMGLAIGTVDESIRSGIEFDRNGGFFTSFGSVISAGSFLSLSIAYLLNEQNQLNRMKSYINNLLIILCLFGIFFTVSRTPVISVFLVFILFFLFPFKPRKLPLVILLVLIGVLFLGSNIFENMILRLNRSDQVFQQNELLTRGGTWIFYIDFFIKNPYLIFLGTFENPFAHLFDVLRSAHNFYLQLYFYGGAFLYYFFVKIFIKMLKFKKNIKLNFLVILTPILIELMAVSEIVIVFPLVVILIISFDGRQSIVGHD